MKKPALISLIIVLLLVSFGLFAVLLNKNTEPQGAAKWSKDDILRAIVTSKPLLLNNNEPVIEVIKTTSPEQGWYITHIKSKKDKQVHVPVVVVLSDQTESELVLHTVFGPDANFSESEMLSRNIPDSVILELKKL